MRDHLEEALLDVIIKPKYSAKLKCEAFRALSEVKALEGIAPLEVKYRIETKEWIKEKQDELKEKIGLDD